MSKALNDKLRRLRREPAAAPASASPPSADRPELPVWLRSKLKGRALDEAPSSGSLEPPREIVAHPDGWAARTRSFAFDHRHGDWQLFETIDSGADRSAPERLTGDRLLAAFDLENAVYLDIEATGLSGGAGTIPFMVALGRFTSSGFELWQGFLRGPEEEAALLAEVADRVRASAGVVSFFGKSYDRHRLEDKMRLHGIEPPFEATPHLDLYHPLARLVKGSLPDAKLQRLERELCCVTRSDDLPGSFAPAAWFDFLRDRPHRLEDVFRHNEDDVLSLVTLAAYLTRVETQTRLDGRELRGCGATRAHSLARWFAGRRDQERALAWTRKAESLETRTTGQLLLAELHRRAGEFEEALAVWLAVAASESTPEHSFGDTLVALVEASKVAEHRLHDAPQALELVQRALTQLRAREPASASLTDLQHRKARLDRKIAGVRPTR